MKTALAIAAAAVLLAGCGDRVADTKAQLAIVRKSGDLDAICAASRKVAAGELERQDAGAYQRDKVAADIDCQAADLARGR